MQIRFPLGLHPRPHWGAAPQALWLHLKGPTSNRRGREREGYGREGKGEGMIMRCNGREERASHSLQLLLWATQNRGPALGLCMAGNIVLWISWSLVSLDLFGSAVQRHGIMDDVIIAREIARLVAGSVGSRPRPALCRLPASGRCL